MFLTLCTQFYAIRVFIWSITCVYLCNSLCLWAFENIYLLGPLLGVLQTDISFLFTLFRDFQKHLKSFTFQGPWECPCNAYSVGMHIYVGPGNVAHVRTHTCSCTMMGDSSATQSTETQKSQICHPRSWTRRDMYEKRKRLSSWNDFAHFGLSH